MSHVSWGADRTTLLLLYRTLVRSKLDCGSFVYASARPSYLRALNSLHNAALRLCTGAFRTSPVPSIHSDAGEPPLCYRRTWLLCSYASKILSMTSHPCYDILFKPRLLNVFNRRSRATRPVSIRFNDFILGCDFKLPDVYPVAYSTYAPWLTPTPTVNMVLLSRPKSSTTPLEYQREYLCFGGTTPI